VSKENMLGIVVALIVGLLGGYLVFSVSGKKEQPVAVGVPQGSGSPTDYQQRIAEAEKVVARDPKNLQAWTQLGNDYFDTDQAQKSINAYSKALELDPNNPNVLTDQGIMYRKVGWYDKAIANFEKAQRLDPQHLQSLFNLGVVYVADLKQNDNAIRAWTRYLQLDTTSPTALQIRSQLEVLKAGAQGAR
jgi:cytochrome c-type biogenesis protein CcmH/NrfG